MTMKSRIAARYGATFLNEMFFMMNKMKGQKIKKKIIAKLPSFLKRNKKII
jgi:hypothetical protein